jgi:phage terminase large subunit-like protein
MPESDKSEIHRILLLGRPEEKRTLFGFCSTDSEDVVFKKFLYFSTNYPRYFPHKPAPFHESMIRKNIRAYRGQKSFLNLAFRGCAKTTLSKLFIAFVLLNDQDTFRKYLKVLTKDGKNSKQVVTDIYNLMIELQPIYGDMFLDDSKKKREETMGSFTMRNGVKLAAGTVGQTQRGHVQDAYRPDFIWFDDIEDRDSADSDTITQNIINKVDEAIQGLSVDGSYMITGNYITDIGVIQNMRGKNVDEMIIPLLDENGVPTWDYFSQEKCDQIRLDAEDWFGEYMCDPVKGADREFKQEYFQKIPFAEVVAKKTRLFLTIDSAVKKDEGSDFSGFCLNWVCDQNKWHFKAWREKLNTGELIDKIFELWSFWQSYGLEVVGLEETAATVAITPFIEEEMRKRNVFIKMQMLKHGGTKKETRIRGLIPKYTSHSIFHIDGECKDLEGELLRFPNSTNDDCSDATAYQTQVVKQPKEKPKQRVRQISNFERFGLDLKN